RIQVEYSFCKIRLPAMGLTLPWQLVAAHDPGPMYLTGSFSCPRVKGSVRSGKQTRLETRKNLFALCIQSAGRICSLITFAAQRSQRIALSFWRRAAKSKPGAIYTALYAQ